MLAQCCLMSFFFCSKKCFSIAGDFVGMILDRSSKFGPNSVTPFSKAATSKGVKMVETFSVPIFLNLRFSNWKKVSSKIKEDQNQFQANIRGWGLRNPPLSFVRNLPIFENLVQIEFSILIQFIRSKLILSLVFLRLDLLLEELNRLISLVDFMLMLFLLHFFFFFWDFVENRIQKFVRFFFFNFWRFLKMNE